MAKVPNSTASKYPRKQASLDYWLGPAQHLGDGPSTDPAIRWNEPKPGTVRKTGEEQPGPYEVEIE